MNVDVDRVKQDWLESEGQFQVKNIASHYGIYEHLFGYAYFIPRITLDIKVYYYLQEISFQTVHSTEICLLYSNLVCGVRR